MTDHFPQCEIYSLPCLLYPGQREEGLSALLTQPADVTKHVQIWLCIPDPVCGSERQGESPHLSLTGLKAGRNQGLQKSLLTLIILSSKSKPL